MSTSAAGRVVSPVASQERGPADWAFLVGQEAAPFAAGEVVAVLSRSYQVVAVEEAPAPGHVDLVARPAG